jgi:monofunctional glycosyltransferase
LKIFYFLLTLPWLLLSEIFVLLDIFCLSKKLNKCIAIVDTRNTEVPSNFIPYLVAAEDHRSDHHYGIDPVAMLRALYFTLIKRRIQGASTIEQQFVRVVTNEYDISFRRKLIEQLLAIALASRRDKIQIARAYLAIAYYGSNFEGSSGASRIICKALDQATITDIISIVARLKYPETVSFSLSRQIKLVHRINHIGHRTNSLSKESKNRKDTSIAAGTI